MISYFLGNEHLGDHSASSDSIAYFCRLCGDIWGRAVSGPEWQIEQVPCISHLPSSVADIRAIPGSFLNGLLSSQYVGNFRSAGTFETLPPTVLSHELEVHMQYKEKELSNGN